MKESLLLHDVTNGDVENSLSLFKYAVIDSSRSACDVAKVSGAKEGTTCWGE